MYSRSVKFNVRPRHWPLAPRLFYSAGQFGPVDLALHWPEGASERKFGPQGCSFCAGPKCKSDRDVAAIWVVFRRLDVSQFISGEWQTNPVDGDRNIALSGATERRHKRATHAEHTNQQHGGRKFSGLTCSQLKVEITHIGDNTSVRKNDICYRRRHILCGL